MNNNEMKKEYLEKLSNQFGETEFSIKEAKEILDVEDVIASILIVENLRIQKD